MPRGAARHCVRCERNLSFGRDGLSPLHVYGALINGFIDDALCKTDPRRSSVQFISRVLSSPFVPTSRLRQCRQIEVFVDHRQKAFSLDIHLL